MKKLIIFFLIIGTALVQQSCTDFLEEVPISQQSPLNFYNNFSEAEQAVTGVYKALRENGLFANGQDMMYITSDIQRAAQFNNRGGLGDYTFDGSNFVVNNVWRKLYKAIGRANSVIENVNKNDKIQGWEQIEAEARFLRAFSYFNLVRMFQNIPLVLESTKSLDEVNVPQNAESEVYAAIIEDLQFAELNAKEKGEVQYGRVTSSAASGMLAKVYLTIASNKERRDGGDGSAEYQLAAATAKKVIDSGLYSLVDYYPDVFHRRNKGHDENLFAMTYQIGPDNGGQVGVIALFGSANQGGGWGGVTATEYYHTIFEPQDSVRRFWNCWKSEIINQGGQRVYRSIETDDWGAVTPWNGYKYWRTWKIAKFRRFPESLNFLSSGGFFHTEWDIDDPLLRYAEILLTYAEALNEINNGPTAEAYDAVNQVRRRSRNVNVAGTGIIHDDIFPRELEYREGMSPDFENMSQEEFFNAILDERARELGGEQGAFRWFDLVRTGLLVEKIKALATTVIPVTGEPEPNWGAANFIEDKHIRLPIPNTELDANPLLKQNPGY